MEKAAALDARDLRPLVLVIGGFLDQILGNSYAVSARYPADLRARHDVWFREHYESRKMRDIVNIYASKAIPWPSSGTAGAGTRRSTSSPANSRAHRSAHQPRSRIAQGTPRRRLPNVRHWLNIHIDYSQSTWFDIPNLVARIGGPWEAAENADVNVSCPPDMTHAWAWGMFERYGEKGPAGTRRRLEVKKLGKGAGNFLRKVLPFPSQTHQRPAPPLSLQALFTLIESLPTGLGKTEC